MGMACGTMGMEKDNKNNKTQGQDHDNKNNRNNKNVEMMGMACGAMGMEKDNKNNKRDRDRIMTIRTIRKIEVGL